jgi:hypothetical protein
MPRLNRTFLTVSLGEMRSCTPPVRLPFSLTPPIQPTQHASHYDKTARKINNGYLTSCAIPGKRGLRQMGQTQRLHFRNWLMYDERKMTSNLSCPLCWINITESDIRSPYVPRLCYCQCRSGVVLSSRYHGKAICASSSGRSSDCPRAATGKAPFVDLVSTC